MTSLVTIIVALIIVGFLLWAVQQLPLDQTIKSIIRVLAIVGVVLWLISRFVPGVL